MSERQCVDCKEMVDISDLTEEIAELRAEIERLEREAIRYAEMYREKDSMLTVVSQSYRNLEREIERLRGELASANLSYLRISDDRDTLRARLAAADDMAVGLLHSFSLDDSIVVANKLTELIVKLRGRKQLERKYAQNDQDQSL